MIYFDTSYLVRLYLRDHGFAEVRELAAREEIVVSIHGRVETAAALHRAFRERRLNQEDFQHLLRQFRADYAGGGIQWLPLTDAVFERAETAFLDTPADTYLRAADALHLACAADHGLQEIYSNDRHLLTAASLFGLRGVNLIGA